MDRNYGKLTVYFENQFWVSVFERIENGKLSVCKVTFGSEPKDYEVREYVLKNYYQLKFSPAVDVVVKKEAIQLPAHGHRQLRDRQGTAVVFLQISLMSQ